MKDTEDCISDVDDDAGFRTKEPDFTDNTACLPTDMHADWLSVLAAENSRRISEATETDHVFINFRSAEYIFTACTRLRLPSEVKYAALLIFDNFMVKLVNGLHECIYNSNRSDREKYREWEHIEAALSRQMTLRIVSAIQIASKMHNYYESVTIRTAKLCLRTLGSTYTEEAIVRSEMRVLTTIDWETTYQCTPLTYAESLFKILRKLSQITVKLGKYFGAFFIIGGSKTDC
ncbi:unnamed protein product [Gongylonema pulchrum]|uniref:Cyclin N-terminal domain-containing protein n=1 Tax=Gongylonema pulchrum TaxID=637853 RepID=A0A183EAI2_9BILA|nr:unnamed protein product [Gongylonema pulchrum]